MRRVAFVLGAARGPRATSLLLVSALVAGCSPPTPSPSSSPTFEARWRDGRAEINAYRLRILRYGASRAGQAALIYVTEPWSARERVKIESPAHRPSDLVDVLKLNVARDFQTGIYDYNTMVSTFVRVADLSPLEVAFTSTEWCGSIYEELRVDPGRIAQQVRSYFEGESGDRTLTRPPEGLLEDELFVRVRGLHGDWLAPGEQRSFPYLEGALWRRLAHRPATWTTAEVERLALPHIVTVPAGIFATTRWVVRIAGGRTAEIDVEREEPRRIIRWSWSALASDGRYELERAELAGSRRLSYWGLTRPGDERYLDSLGIAPLPGPHGRQESRRGPAE